MSVLLRPDTNGDGAVAASLGEGAAGCALEAKRAGAEPKLR